MKGTFSIFEIATAFTNINAEFAVLSTGRKAQTKSSTDVRYIMPGVTNLSHVNESAPCILQTTWKVV